MEIQQIEQNVDSLLSACGFKKDGAEQPLRVLLHHLYSAVAMYKETSDSERAVIAKTNKKFRSIFEINFNLKQRKRNNKEKDRVPPTTPLQDKENKKEKDEKKRERKGGGAFDLDDEQMVFWDECIKFIDKPYSEQMVKNFFYYWAEKNEKNGKMLWQTKKSWNLRMRLAAWSKRSYNVNDEAAAIRLEKTKAKQGGQATTGLAPKSVGVIDAHVPSEHAIALARKEKVDTLEEYLKLHPGSPLAKYR